MTDKSEVSEMSEDLTKMSEKSENLEMSEMSEELERFTKPRTTTSGMLDPPEERTIRKLNIDKLKKLAKQYNITGVSRHRASRKGEIVEKILEKRRSSYTGIPTIAPQENTVEESKPDVGWLVLGLLAVGSLGVYFSSKRLLNKLNGNER